MYTICEENFFLIKTHRWRFGMDALPSTSVRPDFEVSLAWLAVARWRLAADTPKSAQALNGSLAPR